MLDRNAYWSGFWPYVGHPWFTGNKIVVDDRSLYQWTMAQVGWLGPKVGVHPVLSLHLSNNLGELRH